MVSIGRKQTGSVDLLNLSEEPILFCFFWRSVLLQIVLYSSIGASGKNEQKKRYISMAINVLRPANSTVGKRELERLERKLTSSSEQRFGGDVGRDRACMERV